LPGCQVYAGGYATVLLLDAAVAVPQRDSGVLVRVGGKKVLKIDEEYAIMVAGEDDVVRVYRSGVLIPPAGGAGGPPALRRNPGAAAPVRIELL